MKSRGILMDKETMRLYQAERRRKIKAGGLQPREGSTNDWLATFEIGEVRWLETTLETYARDQRALNVPHSRRPNETQTWCIETMLYTAVSSSKAGDIHYLLKVRRVA